MHTFKCIQKHKWIMRAHQQRRRLRCRRHTGSLHGKSNRAALETVWHVLDRSDCTFTFEPKDEKTYLVTLFNGTLTFSLYALCCLHEHNHHNNFSLGHFQAAKNAFVLALRILNLTVVIQQSLILASLRMSIKPAATAATCCACKLHFAVLTFARLFSASAQTANQRKLRIEWMDFV